MRAASGARRRVPGLGAVALPVVLVAMVSLAGVVLGRVYAGPLLTRLVVGAAVGSVLVSVAARRLPSWLVAPLSMAALAGYGALAMRLAAREAGLTGDLAGLTLEAARNGIPRLLTAMIPVEAVPDTVLVPLVAAWLAGLAGAEVAVRAGRVLAGYLPPAVFYAGVLYVVGPNADPAVGPTLVFAAVAAVGLALPGGTASGPVGPDPADRVAGVPGVGAAMRIRLALANTAGVVAVVVLAALLGPLVAARITERPVDPRRYVQPPQVETLDENPLIRISGWALNPEQKLLDVRTGLAGPAPAAAPGTSDGPIGPDGPAPDGGTPGGSRPGGSAPVRIRLAVLSDYDGVTWRVGATYRNAGRVLPPVAPVADRRVDTVRQEITVDGLSGRLLPAVATPQEVDGARVAYDPGTGTLIHPEGLRPGLRYTVTSAREHQDGNLLPSANVPAGPQVARVLQVPDGVPDALRRLAGQLAADNGAPYARAAAIEQFLAEHYRLVADAPSGHAYPNLNFFLFGPRNGGGQRGTSEQFAAAFAVLGRLTGLPTRVVVGFSPPAGDGPVRAADAYAWPEVLFEDLGWVAFDPLPQPRTEPRPVEEDFRPEPEETPPPEAPAPTVDPTPSATPVAAAPARPAGTPLPLLVAGATGLLFLVVALLLATVVLLRRRQRRRRLTGGGPADRVAGAWREVTDALRLAGRPAPGHLSASEVAAWAQETAPDGELAGPVGRQQPARAGGPATPVGEQSAPAGGLAAPVGELAGLVNTAAFAPGRTTDEQARRAAVLAVAYVSALRATRPWWRRLWWSVRPGPLRWPR
nr:transglutaminase domain-containing protein [Micromonospora echinofusca]